ncbi:Polyhydroxybutyrate depolymerase [Candidatus Terasakiella magnetica]|uniref:Polyhydroxybutyrate depolymerase n=1 Tax=Candidatus Terasakiella magnetica TaxID=1867952 RepID=A0A1C3RH77_9PROT|nr:PHB depolymerase family esterase [Candidatus Terasakiella magnetica]SCA56640.1 Polyhydroxybutyrate depolymerase [Candidatus Terasakiella magnetica]
MTRGCPVLSTTIIVISMLITTISLAAEPLPSYKVDLKETSVSGLSSGAYMADQFHVAFSSTIKGAGIIAGGPYNCADASLMTALGRCMKPSFFSGSPDGKELAAKANKIAANKMIDDLSNLKGNKVYIFSGTKDETVDQKVGDQVKEFYQAAGLEKDDIRYVNDIAAGHAMITQNYGNGCSTASKSPYISKCDRDEAGNLLKHIYDGALNTPSEKPGGKVIGFAQGEFLANPTSHSLADEGYAFIPEACEKGEMCKVHIVFHGCQQNVATIGKEYIENAGYNRWADSNKIIVLYPQTSSNLSGNPKGCWDWWGYDSDHYYTKKGNQMAAVKAMLSRLSGSE